MAHFISLARMHFLAEEGLMAQMGYPGVQEHREVHAQLIRQVQDIQGQLRRGEIALDGPLLRFLEDWLICHFQAEDREFSRHLQAIGR